jgi:hypothetical protein
MELSSLRFDIRLLAPVKIGSDAATQNPVTVLCFVCTGLLLLAQQAICPDES